MHPPFVHEVDTYKVGLAASHGKPAGILDYIPRPVQMARGKQEFNASRGSGQKWVGAPVAEEYALGMAHGLACAGNYLPNYSLELGRHIAALQDPEDRRIQEALSKYGAFAAGHPEVYAGARPGSPVAVLYSLTAGPRQGEILGLNRGDTNKTLWSLINGGVPCEVIVEDDLTPARLAGTGAVLADGITVLEPDAARGLAEFVRAGGTLVVAGPGKVRSRYEEDAQARLLSDFLPGLPPCDSQTFAPADLALDGYEISIPYAKVSGEVGRATATFAGRPGRYRVQVSYLDEDDGRGSYDLEVDGKQVAQWAGDKDDNGVHTFVSPAVSLKPGAQVTVVGHAGGGEYGRITQVRVTGDAGGVQECRIGKGKVLQLPDRLSGCTAEDRERVLAHLRPLCPVRAGAGPWPEKLLVNLTRAGDPKRLYAHLVNYDFRYDEKHALQAIQPAGPVTLKVGKEYRSARLLSPDAAPVELKVAGGAVVVPAVATYGVVVLERR